MNYDRYTVPVIVAATIHAALLIWIPTQTGATNPPLVPVSRIKPPSIMDVEIPVTRAGEGEAPHSGGGGIPAPQSPEVLRPVLENTVFTVPSSSAVNDAPPHQAYLPTNPIGDSGDGPGDWTKVGPLGPCDLTSLDHTPRTRAQPAPFYPAVLRSTGTEGRVVVEFTVDTSGRVTSATVLSSTQREFEDETIRAVMKWRFEPGRRNGRAVPFRMTVPLEFRLSDGA